MKDLANYKDFQVVNLRYFNPIWAHKSGLIWENPNGIPNNLFPFIMKVVVWELKAVQIFWDDYDTKDGTGERDYIHVLDLIEGHLKVLQFIEKNKNQSGFFEAFNLGTGNATTVKEMIQFTSELIGEEVPFLIKPRRNWDLSSSFCNPKKAEEILGWKANFSVKEAIEDSLNFIKNR